MIKNTRRSIFLPVTISIISTIVVFAAAEYVFHIPSRFFQEESLQTTQIPDNQNWNHIVATWSQNQATILDQNSQTGDLSSKAPQNNLWSDTIPAWTTVSTWDTVPNLVTQTSQKTDSNTTCVSDYAPVCGANGRTYSNTCMANKAKTIVAYEGDCKQQTTENIQPTEVSIATGWTLVFDTGSYQIYTNTVYSFALPKYAYYSGFGAQGEASHTVAVGLTSTGTDAFATADVRIYFFKTIPANPPEGKQVSVAKGILYIAGDSSNPKVAKIIDTIEASAK